MATLVVLGIFSTVLCAIMIGAMIRAESSLKSNKEHDE